MITPGKVEELGEDAIASGHASPAGFDVVQESGSIQSLPGKNYDKVASSTNQCNLPQFKSLLKYNMYIE